MMRKDPCISDKIPEDYWKKKEERKKLTQNPSGLPTIRPSKTRNPSVFFRGTLVQEDHNPPIQPMNPLVQKPNNPLVPCPGRSDCVTAIPFSSCSMKDAHISERPAKRRPASLSKRSDSSRT